MTTKQILIMVLIVNAALLAEAINLGISDSDSEQLLLQLVTYKKQGQARPH